MFVDMCADIVIDICTNTCADMFIRVIWSRREDG